MQARGIDLRARNGLWPLLRAAIAQTGRERTRSTSTCFLTSCTIYSSPISRAFLVAAWLHDGVDAGVTGDFFLP